MKALVVGGAGMIGAKAALRFRDKGYDVTVAGRTEPPTDSAIGDFPFLKLDYIADEDPRDCLRGFELLIFAAGNDIRHVPEGVDYYEHVTHANAVAQPRFFQAAKSAGVSIAINIGSYYPHVAKHLLESNPYMRSRLAAHEGISALKSQDFRVVSVDAPFVLGSVPGLRSSYDVYVQYSQGKLGGIPVFAPPGGVNFVSTDTVVDAVEATITKGENGRAFLIGDQNATFQQFLGAFFEAVGKPVPPIVDQEHPLLPDSLITWGRGNNLFYDTDPQETAMLAYRRNDAFRAIREDIVPHYLERERAAGR